MSSLYDKQSTLVNKRDWFLARYDGEELKNKVKDELKDTKGAAGKPAFKKPITQYKIIDRLQKISVARPICPTTR